MTCKCSASLSIDPKFLSGRIGRCRRSPHSDFSQTPVWCRKPQPLVYQLCAEGLTKGALAPTIPEAERKLLWCSTTWINILIEKHAWLSAGLVWMPSASESGRKAEHNDPESEEPQPLPTINIFELWENGSQQAKSYVWSQLPLPHAFRHNMPIELLS